MGSVLRVTTPDPGWAVAVQQRNATLWLGPDFAEMVGNDIGPVLRELLQRPWAAVVVDVQGLPLREIELEETRFSDLVLRVIDANNLGGALPANRVPIYALHGVAPGTSKADSRAVLARLRMLSMAPLHRDVVVLGIGERGGWGAVEQAAELADALGRWIIAGEALPEPFPLKQAETVFHWAVGLDEALRFFREIAAGESASDTSVFIRTAEGGTTVNLAGAIDPNFPVSEFFDLVPASATLGEAAATEEDLQLFLRDPSASWKPYVSGIPVPRHHPYQHSLHRLVESLAREGAAGTVTAWLPAEDASGATTVLRLLCLGAAQLGCPVLVAKRDAQAFDVHRVVTFLARAAERIEEATGRRGALPWVIAFDAQHVVQRTDFVLELAGQLRKLLQPAVVLAVRPVGRLELRRDFAAGVNRTLGEPLSNTVSLDEARQVGEHLAPFLPFSLRERTREWGRFAEQAVRTRVEGRASLFWVALRYWLYEVAGTGESLRAWLSRKLAEVASAAVGGAEAFYVGLLEVCVFSRYRLPIPVVLLEERGRIALRNVIADSANPFGLRRLEEATSVSLAFSHPIIADEFLSIAYQDAEMLRAVEMDVCMSLVDLELHLLRRVLRRPACVEPDALRTIENLVTSGLRVDQYEAPRNYAVREEIVDLLEEVPEGVWDQSQVFNHHLARARRYLAIDPPDQDRWPLDARIEQLDLAEGHLLDALQYVRPEDEDRRESELNLLVTLGLTLDARARLEEEHGQVELATEYQRRASQAYRDAMRFDAENSYVLENFARLNIRLARDSKDDPEARVALVTDAITMLDLELSGRAGQARADQILLELGRAYDLLESGTGRTMLRAMAEAGSEAAAVALAKLILRDVSSETERVAREVADSEAERLLRAVPAAQRTARSLVLLYQLASRLRPHEFLERSMLLEELARDREYHWPMQLLVERAILLFQVGGPHDREEARDIFRQVRESLPFRGGEVEIPPELRFLVTAGTGFRERQVTAVKVRSQTRAGPNMFAIPHGWQNVEVILRPHFFGERIRPGQELECIIQFTAFGPQAVPTTMR